MIVIKTMTELPEHCYECPCHDGESGYCQADKEHRYSDYRPFWCPLEEVNDQQELQEEKRCSNCKFWCLDANDKNRKCKYCYNQDEWQAESEENKEEI